MLNFNLSSSKSTTLVNSAPNGLIVYPIRL